MTSHCNGTEDNDYDDDDYNDGNDDDEKGYMVSSK